MEAQTKVLLIRFSSIGDIVLTSSLVEAIKRQQPNVELHYVSKKAYASTLSQIPGIDKTHFLGVSYKDLADALQKEQFSAVIDLHNNLRSRRLCMGLSKCNGRLKKLNFKKWLLVNFKINRMPEVHIVDRYFEAAKSLGVQNDSKPLRFKSNELGDISLSESLGSTPFIALSLGATHLTKRMEADELIKLCSLFAKRVVLVGGKDTQELSEKIERKVGSSIINLNGKLSLAETARVFELSKGVLGFDTGAMHIASAKLKKVALIWGNTVPEFGMGPYQPGHEKNISCFEREMGCRPCSKIGYSACPKGHFKCMRDHNLEAIAMTVNDW